MNEPVVSICIPTYNGEEYLEECLNSAVGQTYQNIEIVIVDDLSKDKTISIIREYMKKDDRIKLFINEANLGLVGNWNKSVQCATGEWIKYLFQDDVLESSCVKRMIELIAENCKMIVCDRHFIFENSISEEIKDQYRTKLITLQKIINVRHPVFINNKRISKMVSSYTNNLTNSNFIGEPSVVMFRRSLQNEIGDFNPLLVQVCDFEYWLRVGTNFGLFYIPESLVSFRIHSRSMTANNRNTRMDLVDTLILLFNLLKSDYYNNFRKHLSKGQRSKILEIFKLRIYEIRLFFDKNVGMSELIDQYVKVKAAIPEIAKHEIPSLKTKLIYSFVKIRRKIRS